MGKKKRNPGHKGRQKKKQSSNSNTVSLRLTPGGDAWVLVPPRCARDRAEDLEEVRLMIEAGEVDVALDELRWLLSGCPDCLDAHLLLGQLAASGQNDVQLARGHFGYAYQLGLRAWRRAGEPMPVPGSQPANRTFHEAGKSLAWCLKKLGKGEMAAEVVATLLRLDPSDPLGAKAWHEQVHGGGLPLIGPDAD
ncbi:MAG: tetratricopeptide repeat protein [Aeoliella sp.]